VVALTEFVVDFIFDFLYVVLAFSSLILLAGCREGRFLPVRNTAPSNSLEALSFNSMGPTTTPDTDILTDLSDTRAFPREEVRWECVRVYVYVT